MVEETWQFLKKNRTDGFLEFFCPFFVVIKMKKTKKRIAYLFCAFIITAYSVFTCPLKAQAAALPIIGEVAGEELLMIVLDLLITGLVVGGATEIATNGNYEEEMKLLQSYIDFAKSTSENLIQFQVAGTSQVITLADFISDYVDGTGALQLPDEETWSRFRVIEGGGSGDQTPGEDPEDPGDPEPEKFSFWDNVKINAAMFATIGDFVTQLFNGEVEGIQPETYFGFGENGFSEYEMINGFYHIEGDFTVIRNSSAPSNLVYKYFIEFNQNVSGKPAFLRLLNDDLQLLLYSYEEDLALMSISGIMKGYDINGNFLLNSSFRNGLSFNTDYYSTLISNVNIPVFDNAELMENFLRTGDETGILNKIYFDYDALIANIDPALAPLAGIELAPSALPGLNVALANALDAYPLPDIEPAENTSQYKEVVNDVISEFVPAAAPVPDPDPVPEPTPDPEPIPGGENVEDINIKNYATDLRQIFPFCIPFDLIALLDALDAAPVAPKFEVPFKISTLNVDEKYVIDLSMFDDQMAILRKLETIGFLIGLMVLTGKVIKW